MNLNSEIKNMLMIEEVYSSHCINELHFLYIFIHKYLTNKSMHKSVNFKVAAGEIDRGYTCHELQRSMLKIRHKRWLSQWIGGGGYSLPESFSSHLRPPTSLHQPSLSLFSLAQISQFISCEHILLILCARAAPACYQTVHGSHIRSNTHRPGRLSSACRYYSNLARAALQWLQCRCQRTKWLQCTIWNWSSSLALWFARSKLQAVFGGRTTQVKELRP